MLLPRKGYLAPPVVIILALIVLGVAATLIVNAKLFPKPKENPQPQISTQPSPIVSPSPTADASREPNGSAETANWETYTNTRYGYSIQYPQDMVIRVQKEDEVVFLYGKRFGLDINSTTEISRPLKNYAEIIDANPERTFEEVNIGGVLGYKLTWPSVYGALVLLPNSRSNTILKIGFQTLPTDQIAKKTFNQILSTVRFE